MVGPSRLVAAWRIVVGVLVGALLVPLAGPALAEPNGPELFCAKARAYLGPQHAHVGDLMAAGGRVTNCANRGEGIRVVVSGKGPCGVEMGFDERVRLRTGQFVEVQFPQFIAQCPGRYSVVVEAFRAGVLLDRSKRRVRVLP
jgi:hypothetical protein